jgi:hypothetical protein
MFPWHGNSLLIQNCFAKCCFSYASSVNVNEENCKSVKLQCHIDCPSTFDEFLNFDKSVPATRNETSLDTPGPNSMDMIGQEEEKTETSHPAPQQDTLTAFAVLDSVITLSDADENYERQG